ncbi:CASP-like protein [Platanthera guangdongensis]|uniref:CASP-like protein n=1 Tax=Platanthera guangdongensis TaxID=2320717 RepID=A0ABR2MQH4_9ASPA
MEETMTSPLRSPLHDVEDPTLNSDAIVHRQEETGDPPPFLPGTPEIKAKAAVKSSSKSNAAFQSENSRVVTWILRNQWSAKAVRRASLADRAAATMFCLLSFSVMAADKGRGWASDSFNRYKEYRYCVSVNVIGFVYAGFQAYSEVNRRICDEEIIRQDPTLNSDAIVHRQEETGDPPPFLPGTPEIKAKAAVKSSSKSNAAFQSENSRVVTWILRNQWSAKASK